MIPKIVFASGFSKRESGAKIKNSGILEDISAGKKIFPRPTRLLYRVFWLYSEEMSKKRCKKIWKGIKKGVLLSPLLEKKPTGSENDLWNHLHRRKERRRQVQVLYGNREREKRVNFESDPERRTNGKRKKRKKIYNEEFDPGSG